AGRRRRCGQRPGRRGLDDVRAGPRDEPGQQRPRHAHADRARTGADRGRHLRRLRELRSADRQESVDGVPPCDTVPDMQAEGGASL
ncbi:MAG: RNA polymerase-binding transcription factor DksA, partial [uncultured Nocardioidaceae bacterium]